MKRVFAWTGPIAPKGDVQQIGRELDRIHKAEGIIMPEKVVEAARPIESPLHHEFEWDDAKAAEKFRIDQARGIIQNITVTIRKGETEGSVRAFVFLRSEARGYRDTVAVLNNEESRRHLLEDALRDADIFRRKYATLHELGRVFEAIEEVAQLVQEPVAAG